MTITVFTARRIHTMCESAPHATAVAVKDGVILEAGTLDTLQPWLSGKDHVIDRQFEDKILMPGFIDPHIHPYIASIILPASFVTAFEWDLPGNRKVPATRGQNEYLSELRDQFEARGLEKPLFVAWGYHQIWHGKITRAHLNAISADRPVIVIHRSFHTLIMNDAAIDALDLDREMMARHPQIDLEEGRLYETGAMAAINKLNPYFFSPDWFDDGLRQFHKVVHNGGHTTVGDMSWGVFDRDLEWGAYARAMGTEKPPYRMLLVTTGMPHPGSEDIDAVADLDGLLEKGTDRLMFRRSVKLFTDGAIFSEQMQMNEPGFIDGHSGEWLMGPELYEEVVRKYWHAGYKIHVHCTGDLGLDLAIDTLAKMQEEKPRFDHRYTIEHFGISTEDQVRRMKALGAIASVNVYYLHELGEAYWLHSVGHERASQMARVGSLAREGVAFALHTDYTMAPALPLTSAWVAVNRIAESGAVLGPGERISVHQAMRAITIDAAWILGLEDMIGSIRSGKKADFTVLAEDPYEVDPVRLKDIAVIGTVFEGDVHLLQDG